MALPWPTTGRITRSQTAESRISNMPNTKLFHLMSPCDQKSAHRLHLQDNSCRSAPLSALMLPVGYMSQLVLSWSELPINMKMLTVCQHVQPVSRDGGTYNWPKWRGNPLLHRSLSHQVLLPLLTPPTVSLRSSVTLVCSKVQPQNIVKAALLNLPPEMKHILIMNHTQQIQPWKATGHFNSWWRHK